MSKRLHNPKSHAPAVYIPCWLIQVPIKLLSHGAKITYGRLSQWANESGIVYRSAKQLSEELGVSYRSIEEYIRELKESDLIGTYRKQAGGLNHFEFYDHPWMHEPINPNLAYKSNDGDPPNDSGVPSAGFRGTPPQNSVDINKKEIKLNNKELKEKRSLSKSDNLSIEDILKNNPHNIPEDLLAEWKKSRKKPITKRVLDAFNRELYLILESGIQPLIAVNKMLDRQWTTVELKFFANDIASNRPNYSVKEKLEDPTSKLYARYNNNSVTIEHGALL